MKGTLEVLRCHIEGAEQCMTIATGLKIFIQPAAFVGLILVGLQGKDINVCYAGI